MESFLVKVVGRLGGDAGDEEEIRVLNRTLRWTSSGIAYEADPRRAVIAERQLLADGIERASMARAVEVSRCPVPLSTFSSHSRFKHVSE